MAINFPSSPSADDTYTFSGKTWKWNGSGWEKSTATETGNTEGNTGEVAYYGVKGSTIKGATAFYYDDTNRRVGIGTSGPAASLHIVGGGLSADGVTAGTLAISGYLQWPDGTTQATRENITFELDGSPLDPTDEPHRTLDIRSVDQTDISISSQAAQADTARYIFGLGNNIPKLDESNTFTATNGNIFETPIGSNRYAGNNIAETVRAATDHASATYMGITSGTINYKILGTHILDMDTDIHAFVGISADGGATFGGDIMARSDIYVADNIIHSGDGNTKIEFATDEITLHAGGQEHIRMKTDNSGLPTISELHIKTGLSADAGATFGSNVNIIGTGNYISFPDGLTQGSSQTDIIGIHVDNGSSVLTTGIKGHRTLPYGCEISDWRVTSTDTGDISWGINYSTYDNYPTMKGISIHVAENPDLESQNKNKSSGDVDGRWTPYQFSAGDILQFEIDSVATITDCTLELTIRRTS